MPEASKARHSSLVTPGGRFVGKCADTRDDAPHQLGTRGGPLPSRNRAQTSNLLIVNGTYYLTDAGDGVLRRLTREHRVAMRTCYAVLPGVISLAAVTPAPTARHAAMIDSADRSISASVVAQEITEKRITTRSRQLASPT